MAAAKWSVDRECLARRVPEGERMTAGCAVTYGRAPWGLLPRRAPLLPADRRVRVLRHRGNDLRYSARGIWFEMPRGEADAVCVNPQVRVEFDKGQESNCARPTVGWIAC